MTVQIATVLVILTVMTISFFAEIIPLSFTALMVPLLFQVTGILTPAQAWAGFSNTTIITWLGLFIIGSAFAKTSVTYRIKKLTAKYGNGNKFKVFAVCLFSNLLLAVLISSTASVAVLCPIIREICEDNQMDEKRVMKGANDAGTWASILTFPIGSSLTYIMMCSAYITGVGGTQVFGMFDWTILKLPTLIIFVITIFISNRKLAQGSQNTKAVVEDDSDNDRHTVYTPFQEKCVIAIFCLNCVLMVVGNMTSFIPAYLVCIFFAVMTIALKLMTEKEAINSISWSTVFLVAGTLPIATAINATGTGAWLAETFKEVFPSISNATVLAVTLCIICTILTQFMSNSAVMATFGPLGASMALAYGVDPRIAVAGAVYGAINCFATPMATTSNAYIYGFSGFKMKEFVRMGWFGTVLLVVLFALWGPFVLNMLYA